MASADGPNQVPVSAANRHPTNRAGASSKPGHPARPNVCRSSAARFNARQSFGLVRHAGGAFQILASKRAGLSVAHRRQRLSGHLQSSHAPVPIRAASPCRYRCFGRPCAFRAGAAPGCRPVMGRAECKVRQKPAHSCKPKGGEKRCPRWREAGIS